MLGRYIHYLFDYLVQVFGCYMQTIVINRNRCTAHLKRMIAEIRVRLSHIDDDVLNPNEFKFAILVSFVQQCFRL